MNFVAHLTTPWGALTTTFGGNKGGRMAGTTTTLEATRVAMQTANREMTALTEAITAAEAVRDDRNGDPVARLEVKHDLERLHRTKAIAEVPQLKVRQAYERAVQAHRLDQWRTTHQPRITSAIKALDHALVVAVTANQAVANALAEAHKEGNVVESVQWLELLPQCGLRNRDSRVDTWRRTCREYGYL